MHQTGCYTFAFSAAGLCFKNNEKIETNGGTVSKEANELEEKWICICSRHHQRNVPGTQCECCPQTEKNLKNEEVAMNPSVMA